MGILSVGTIFVGYLLVYAAVANKGRFATAPWAGIVADAYDTTQKPLGGFGLGG